MAADGEGRRRLERFAGGDIGDADGAEVAPARGFDQDDRSRCWGLRGYRAEALFGIGWLRDHTQQHRIEGLSLLVIEGHLGGGQLQGVRAADGVDTDVLLGVLLCPYPPGTERE